MIDALCRLKYQTNLTQLQSFLRLCNVFRRFVPNFKYVANLLDEKIRKGQLQTFDRLSDEKVSSFETLEAEFEESPVLALPRYQGIYTVEKDACDRQIECVQLQNQPDGTDRPSRYWCSS